MVKGEEIIKKALEDGRSFLLEHESKTFLALHRFPVTRIDVAKSKEEAVRKAEQIGFPVVLKIISPDILHKSDVGGVKVKLMNREEVEKAYDEIINNVKKAKEDARIIGMLVQEYAPAGREVIVGLTKDPQFGPTIMFGVGGIFVEIYEDVSFRVAPIDYEEAEEMIKEIRGYKLLMGARGEKPSDIEVLKKIIVGVSDIAMKYPMIKEMDLNPIEVYEKGAKIVDARIILEV